MCLSIVYRLAISGHKPRYFAMIIVYLGSRQ
nr:MAG TPA: hypothetical protein [Caudoviricetes sp.]